MPGDVEFLSGPDRDDEDPTFEAPVRRARPLVWLALAVLVAAAAVWVATRPSDTGAPAAAPTRTVTESPSPTHHSSSTTLRMCSAGEPVNKQLVMIAERKLTGLLLMPAESYTCATGVGLNRKPASVSIAVSYHSLVVEIQASRRVGDAGQYVPTPARRDLISLVTAESQSAGLNVTVEVFGRSGTKVDGVLYSDLASDVSLQLVL